MFKLAKDLLYKSFRFICNLIHKLMLSLLWVIQLQLRSWNDWKYFLFQFFCLMFDSVKLKQILIWKLHVFVLHLHCSFVCDPVWIVCFPYINYSSFIHVFPSIFDPSWCKLPSRFWAGLCVYFQEWKAFANN